MPRPKRIQIVGRSMEPALYEGDWTLFRYRSHGLAPGTLNRCLGKIVLVRRTAAPELLTVKRLIKKLDTGWWVEGDNQGESTDSRQYLTISDSEIVGVFLLRYKRAQRSSG
jgi:hypothetical protein